MRALTLFGLLLFVLVAIAVELAMEEFSLTVLTERLETGRSEAQRIAALVEQVGWEGNGINFGRVRQNRKALQNFIGRRMAESYFITFVEVHDRFGVPQLVVSGTRSGSAGAPQQVVRVALQQAEGEVRVGISMVEELKKLRRALRIKVAIATALALAVLIAGFFYVLHLLRKNRLLEQARQSAGRASYVGLLASGLAHEIRNPLNAININLQLLEEELDAEPELESTEHGELLESSKREIARLEQLVKNFLNYARPPQPRFESSDLNELVEDVVRLLEVDFGHRKVTLQTRLESLLPTIELDETLIKQALINLLVNARDILPEHGTVTVRTRAGAGGEVVLEVVDDGPGIPTEDQSRIFEVFYSRRGGGTGLGLPIASQIVERHGGSIELESTVGEGTTFRIRLPRRHGPHGQKATAESGS